MKYNLNALFLLLSILFSCGQEPPQQKAPKFESVAAIPSIEATVQTEIQQKKSVFQNTSSNQEVKVLHSIEKTGFHVYNAVAFKTDDIGAIAGGTGLRVRTTQDGGTTWQQTQLSQFANSFHALAYTDQALFVVGESEYIFQSLDNGKNWKAFNTKSFFDGSPLLQVKLYKIRFLDNGLGFIGGEQNGHPVLLITKNGGINWAPLALQGLDDLDSITDLALLSENELLVVTQFGKCYKSTNQGKTWTLLYQTEKQYDALNSIAFKDTNTGCIGGTKGKFLYTQDAGITWTAATIPNSPKGCNVSDIVYLKNKAVVTTAVSFGDRERNPFVYEFQSESKALKPFLTKADSTIQFIGDSYGLYERDNSLFVLDRNNLYQTD